MADLGYEIQEVERPQEEKKDHLVTPPYIYFCINEDIPEKKMYDDKYSLICAALYKPTEPEPIQQDITDENAPKQSNNIPEGALPVYVKQIAGGHETIGLMGYAPVSYFETLFDLILPYDAMVVTVDYNGQLDILQGREIYSFVMPKVR